jgi:hypothetical protein
VIGTAKAHATSAAASAVGPVVINLLGYDVPVLAALASIAGVILASLIAPPPPRRLALWQRIALVLLLCILMLGLVITDPERSILVTTCWAIGIGFTGLPLIEEIQRRIFNRTSELTGPPQSESPTDV